MCVNGLGVVCKCVLICVSWGGGGGQDGTRARQISHVQGMTMNKLCKLPFHHTSVFFLLLNKKKEEKVQSVGT